jgi:hypothetical protein
MTRLLDMFHASAVAFALMTASAIALDPGTGRYAQADFDTQPLEQTTPPLDWDEAPQPPVRDVTPPEPPERGAVPPHGTPIPDLDPTATLTRMGYTDVEPLDRAAATEGEAVYTAIDPDGQPVKVVVDIRTGAVLSETPILAN